MVDKKPEKEIGWHGDDLFYKKLYYVEMGITNCIQNKDWEGWADLLEEEYRFVWYQKVNELSEADNKPIEWWESKWVEVMQLLYDFRNQSDTPAFERIAMQNYMKAKKLLHDLNMLLNKYEIEAGLRIAMREKSDPGQAIKRYG